jgi:hypothetical protein
MPGAVPSVGLAVIDFDAVAAAEIAALTSARWAGFAGTLIAIARAGSVADRIRTVVGVDVLVDPHDPQLRDLLERYRSRR